jgi:hypothetical protein
MRSVTLLVSASMRLTVPSQYSALSGGGGKFGVATRFKFRLHKVDAIVGGTLILPATPDVITSFIAEAEAAPDELSAIVNVTPAPPMPFIPPEHHGRVIVMALMVYAGVAGESAVAPFRSLATPIVDMVRPMRYQEMYPAEEAAATPLRLPARCSSTRSTAPLRRRSSNTFRRQPRRCARRRFATV